MSDSTIEKDISLLPLSEVLQYKVNVISTLANIKVRILKEESERISRLHDVSVALSLPEKYYPKGFKYSHEKNLNKRIRKTYIQALSDMVSLMREELDLLFWFNNMPELTDQFVIHGASPQPVYQRLAELLKGRTPAEFVRNGIVDALYHDVVFDELGNRIESAVAVSSTENTVTLKGFSPLDLSGRPGKYACLKLSSLLAYCAEILGEPVKVVGYDPDFKDLQTLTLTLTRESLSHQRVKSISISKDESLTVAFHTTEDTSSFINPLLSYILVKDASDI